MATLLQRFGAHLDTARLLARPGAAVLAVSGGPDSVALLDLMSSVAPARGLQLIVAHADHGIQPGSATVAQGVAHAANQEGLPFELGRLGLGAGATETAARTARYAWLREVQRRHGARYLVTAHHRDDQVETIVLRVLRGSGPAGLAGMSARGRGGLMRPLLPFTRAELAQHTQRRRLAVHHDPANADPRHVRSWVRAQLLPLLIDRLGAGVPADLLRLGRQAANDRRAWDRVLELVPELDLRTDSHGFDVARTVLSRYHNVLSVALLRAAARRAGMVLGPAAAQRLLTLAGGASGRRVELGGGWEGEAAFERLRVRRRTPVAAPPLVAVGQRGSAAFGGFGLRWAPAPAPATLQRGGWTTWVGDVGWEVRSIRSGDRLRPLGGVGGRAVRRLLTEARVPRSERAGYPVVARGETILWVPGICRSADEVPAPGTPAVRVDVTHGRWVAEADRRD